MGKVKNFILQKRKPLLTFGVIVLVVAAINFNYLWHNAARFFRKKNYYSEVNVSTVAREATIKPDNLLIPSLGIAAPIIYVEGNDEKVLQSALQNGVVHYPKTAKPGEAGNVYIFGHSSDYIWAKGKFKTIFADLPNIKIGEEILASGSSGKVFVYTVMESFAASAKDLHLLSQETGGKKILTLQTSWPLGTALKRWIVRAELK